jgi:polyferredoxin
LLLAGLAWAPLAGAATFAERYPQAISFFAGADRVGEPTGVPPAAPVYRGREILGYVFLSGEQVRIPAYSGKPINVLIGIDTQARIVGASIVEHEEPILVLGINDETMRRYVNQYRGKSAYEPIAVGGSGKVTVDAISGATITTMVLNATITRAARAVAESRALVAGPPLPASAFPATEARPSPAAAPRPASPAAKKPGATAPDAVPPLQVDEELWIGIWRSKVFKIVVLVAGLMILTLILVFQDVLAQHPTLLGIMRTTFLWYTLIFIGWYSLAQLSLMNVLTFVYAFTHDFSWDSFLLDPLLFILWSFVAISLLLWGRGIYCGWLCPFGALQELFFRFARRLRWPVWEFPQAVHERLWAFKYIILLGLFAMSMQSLALAERYIDIEPFKTAITMRFMRDWLFLPYAIGLVLISGVNRKFYCKYLCGLGAAFTIAGKFRIFDWLRRHRECGRPCQICAEECEVRAIKKNGEINPNECHYCLDCQVIYWNAHKCPPVVERRKRRERAEQLSQPPPSVGPSGR